MEEAVKHQKKVETACSTIMEEASKINEPSKAMKLVATNIVKSMLQTSDVIELPTEGPVSIVNFV